MNRLRTSLIIISIAGVCSSGCLHHRLEQPPRKPEPLPESFRQEFGARTNGEFKAGPAPLALDEKSPSWRATTRCYAQHEITLTNSPNAAEKPVEFDYYLPHPRRARKAAGTNAIQAPEKIPGIIILPIMGGTKYELESFFARSLAKRGFATIILHRPDIKKEVHDLEGIDGLLRKSVRDAQRAIDWLEAQPEIDPDRLGLFGVSLGAIRGTLVLAVEEKRLRAGVLGLVGGDLPYILTHSKDKGLSRERKEILERNQLSVKEAEEKLRESITCEPLRVAGAVDPSRVLMVIAAFDHVVPPHTGWQLRRKLGNPAAIQLFSGHYSSVIYAPYLRWKTGKFFEKKFSETPKGH